VLGTTKDQETRTKTWTSSA